MDLYLYRLYDSKDRLLYVGVSCDVARRCNEHKYKHPWYASVTRIESGITPLPWRVAHRLERAIINTDEPIYNVAKRLSDEVAAERRRRLCSDAAVTYKRDMRVDPAARLRRNEEVVELHAIGWTFDALGVKFGISRARAHQIVLRAAMAVEVEQKRKLALERKAFEAQKKEERARIKNKNAAARETKITERKEKEERRLQRQLELESRKRQKLARQTTQLSTRQARFSQWVKNNKANDTIYKLLDI